MERLIEISSEMKKIVKTLSLLESELGRSPTEDEAEKYISNSVFADFLKDDDISLIVSEYIDAEDELMKKKGRKPSLEEIYEYLGSLAMTLSYKEFSDSIGGISEKRRRFLNLDNEIIEKMIDDLKK